MPVEKALLPCPFCGKLETARLRHVRDGRQVFCTACGASSSPEYHGRVDDEPTDRRAADSWNTRALSASPIPEAGHAGGGVVVKALDFQPLNPGWTACAADSILGTYRMGAGYFIPPGGGTVILPTRPGIKLAEMLAEAKAAAQANYEARILAALAASSPSAAIGAEVGAALAGADGSSAPHERLGGVRPSASDPYAGLSATALHQACSRSGMQETRSDQRGQMRGGSSTSAEDASVCAPDQSPVTPSPSAGEVVRWQRQHPTQGWIEVENDDLDHYHREGQTLRPLYATPPAPRPVEADGWLYHNPDTGAEWSEQHPVESGEVPDATDVRPATASELRALMIETWKSQTTSGPRPVEAVEAGAVGKLIDSMARCHSENAMDRAFLDNSDEIASAVVKLFADRDGEWACVVNRLQDELVSLTSTQRGGVLADALAALEGVVRVADRQTVEFDAARAAITNLKRRYIARTLATPAKAGEERDDG